MDMHGKVVLVTGAGGGIGRAACLEFARAGARVAAVDVNRDPGEQTLREVVKLGGEARFFQADVTKAADVKGYVAGTVQAFGRIDAFFNNAGIEGMLSPLAEYPEEVFERVLAVNLTGVFLGLKYVLQVMLTQKSGSIVNTASTGGLHGSPGMSAYAASKHGVVGLTRTAALEVAKDGIRVNAVCPGATNTRMMRSIEEMVDPANPQAALEQFAAVIPSGHYGEPAEVARIVLFLASDASSNVTGVALTVDGGLSAV